jgi:sigma-B regulation protein RsbU (phosphoserine phosphatase)
LGGVDRIQRALPLGVLVLVAALDIVLGPDRVVLTLVVIAPLVAATARGRRATIAYGALAVVVGALLGVYDQQYTAGELPAQVIRLCGITAGTGAAVVACTLRLRREAEVVRLGKEAAAGRAALDTARTLQRHLLGAPPELPTLQSAARYLPASRHAQVGGDWYDGFALPDGGTVLVIGDVAGHDAEAAAMAETRGMLRAIARTTASSPASMLTSLDRVLTGLRTPPLISVVVATVEGGAGAVTLRWSNAGHPPPVLVHGTGTTEVLGRSPERLLGIATPAARRTDHQRRLHPGDTLLFYTNGLVERRHWTLDEGTEWLVGRLEQRGREPLDELCDGLLAELGDGIDDDVAILAVRVPGLPQPPRTDR